MEKWRKLREHLQSYMTVYLSAGILLFAVLFQYDRGKQIAVEKISEYQKITEILSQVIKYNEVVSGLKSLNLRGAYNKNNLVAELHFDQLLRFERAEYRLPADFIISDGYKEIRQIGKSISNNRRKERKSLYENAMNDSELSIDREGIDLALKIDFDAIATLLGRLRNKILNLKTTIYVRGFADGSNMQGWKRPLYAEHHYSNNYDSIIYYPPNKKGRDYDFEFSDTPQTWFIEGEMYGNRDLPILRAKYVIDEFIAPQLRVRGLEDVECRVLGGKAIDRVTNLAKMRFVEVFIEFRW